MLQPLLSKNASLKLQGVDIQTLLSKPFIQTNEALTPSDREKLTLIRKGYDAYITATAQNSKIDGVQAAFQYGLRKLAHKDQEHLLIACLNIKNEIIHQKAVFVGSLDTNIAHPREIFREALFAPTSRIILYLNHPSGNPTPSGLETEFTKRMVDCGKLLGIEVLDHIIVGNGRCYSFKEETSLLD